MTNFKSTYVVPFLLLCFSQKSQACNFNFSQIFSPLSISDKDVLYSDCPVYKKKCNGKKTWKTGDYYEGQFKFGKPNGIGVYTWANGDIYKGHFVAGIPHGFGKRNYSDGSVYEGEWVDGIKHGKGAYSFACGDEFYGYFKDDVIHGEGTILFSNGESYSGNWANSVPDGYGVFARNDGSYFAGWIKEGRKNGSGIVVWETGDSLKTNWVEGKMEDDAVFIFNDGSTMISYWENGKSIDEITYSTPEGETFFGTQESIASIIIQNNYAQLEQVEYNLQIAWYGFAMAYRAMNDLESAKKSLEFAIELMEIKDDNNLSEMLRTQFFNINKELNRSEVASTYKKIK